MSEGGPLAINTIGNCTDQVGDTDCVVTPAESAAAFIPQFQDQDPSERAFLGIPIPPTATPEEIQTQVNDLCTLNGSGPSPKTSHCSAELRLKGGVSNRNRYPGYARI